MPGGPHSTAGVYRCTRCESYLAEAELILVAAPEPYPPMKACPTCRRAVVFEASRVTRPFVQELLGVYRFPLQAESVPYWFGVALVCGVLAWASALGQLFAVCILVGYLFTVIRSSATGSPQPPVAADFLELMDLFRPVLQSAVAIILVSLPAIALAYFGESPEARLGAGLLFLFGLVWLPLALIAAAHADSVFEAFNPLTTFQLFQRLPGAYLQVLLALLTLALAATATAFAVAPVVALLHAVLPPLGYIVGYLHPLYFGMLAARVLGLFVFEHAAELGR